MSENSNQQKLYTLNVKPRRCHIQLLNPPHIQLAGAEGKKEEEGGNNAGGLNHDIVDESPQAIP